MQIRGSVHNRARHETPKWPFVLVAAGLLAGAVTTVLVTRAVASVPGVSPVLEAPRASTEAAADSAPIATGSLPDLTELAARLQGLLSQQEGVYGVYVVDVATGAGAGINADFVFPTASTVKLPVAMYVLNQVEQGTVNLDDLIPYEPSDWEEGTGVLQEEVSEGFVLPLRRLVALTITESDNIATNMLLRHFGSESIAAYMEKLGGTVTHDGQIWSTTPRDMAGYMLQAHNSTTLADPVLRGFLKDLLSSTVFTDRIAAGVPAGTRVEHKIGTLPNVVNDVAMVYGPRRSFVVSVFSRDVNMQQAPQVIADLTHEVFEYEASLGPVSTPPIRAGDWGPVPG